MENEPKDENASDNNSVVERPENSVCIEEKEENTVKQRGNNVVGRPFVKGDPRINRAGRPKGQSLKEYWKQKIANMTEEDKEAFSKDVSNELIWRMCEGNPTEDKNIKGDIKVIIANEDETNQGANDNS